MSLVPSNQIENSFQSHIEVEKINVSRTMCLLGALLYMLFGVADIFSVTTALSDVLLIRGSIVISLMLIYAYTYHPSFLKNYNLTLTFVYLISSVGIESMIYMAQPEDLASSIYFAGLLLVIMTIFAWSYMRIEASFITTITIIISYSALSIVKELPYEEVFVNVFFLFSAASIGFLSQLIRDRYLRENFILKCKLEKSLEDKTEEAKDHLYKANHDELTGLANRRYVTEQLENSLQIAKEKDKILLILFIDLNGFKQINDIYGHAAGDEVLTIVARRLELAVRGSDSLSRLGGDEFLVGLLIEKDHLSDVESMVEKYVKIISDPMNVDGQRLKVGASIGMAAYPIHGNKVSILMDIADKKMYQIKHGRVDKDSDQNRENEPVVIFPGNIRQK